MSSSHNADKYYVAAPSTWPIIGSIALFFLGFGAAGWINDWSAGLPMVVIGFCILLYMLFGWFGQVIGESESGKFNKQVDMSFRWGMGWFIFSEVMFFAAFFGALYYARVLSVPDLASITQKLLWPDFGGSWPTSGPYLTNPFTPMAAAGLPAVNTLILLTSGITVTIAHWGLVQNKRGQLNLFLGLTVALGALFLSLQAIEYSHAMHDNLTLATGVYGATFFMLTGFHGFHVTLGTVMLAVIWFRCMKGHFTADHHFGFEAVAWYWHFVDVVWLGLFVFVYWL